MNNYNLLFYSFMWSFFLGRERGNGCFTETRDEKDEQREEDVVLTKFK